MTRAHPLGRRERVAAGADTGSAAVDFALVAPLVLVIFAAIMQIGLAGYLRATLAAAAADGARAGAMSGATAGTATRRTQAAIDDGVAAGVVLAVRERRTVEAGLPTIAVTIEARIPVLGLLGPTGMTVTGRALQEAA